MKQGASYIRGKVVHMPPGFAGTTTTARLAGLNYRTLVRWCEREVLFPLRVGGRGKGSCYAWDSHQILCATVVGTLRQRVSAVQVRKLANALRAEGADFASKSLIWTPRGRVYVADGGDAVDLQSGQVALLMPLDPVLASLRRRASRAGVVLDFERHQRRTEEQRPN